MNHVGVFQRLVALRRITESLQWGALRGLAVQDGVLLYVRHAEGFAPVLVALNFGQRAATVNFHAYERSVCGVCVDISVLSYWCFYCYYYYSVA